MATGAVVSAMGVDVAVISASGIGVAAVPQASSRTNPSKGTDFSKRSVSLSEIFSGGVPRDGIPPLDDPTFVSVSDADEWLGPKEPVILFENEGDARAYPLQIGFPALVLVSGDGQLVNFLLTRSGSRRSGGRG